MTDPYTEEDRLNHLLEKSKDFRKLFDVFGLELDFTRQPPVKYKWENIVYSKTEWNEKEIQKS